MLLYMQLQLYQFHHSFKMRDYCQYPLIEHENGCRKI